MSKCCDNLSDNRRKQTKQKGKARAKENCGCIFCDLNLPAVYGRNITHGNAVTCSKTLMNFAPIHQAIVYSPYTLARAFMARIKPEISRRRAMASAVYRPCLSAFLFPFGASRLRPLHGRLRVCPVRMFSSAMVARSLNGGSS